MLQTKFCVYWSFPTCRVSYCISLINRCWYFIGEIRFLGRGVRCRNLYRLSSCTVFDKSTVRGKGLLLLLKVYTFDPYCSVVIIGVIILLVILGISLSIQKSNLLVLKYIKLLRYIWKTYPIDHPCYFHYTWSKVVILQVCTVFDPSHHGSYRAVGK